MAKRRSFTADFKTKVVLEIISGERSRAKACGGTPTKTYQRARPFSPIPANMAAKVNVPSEIELLVYLCDKHQTELADCIVREGIGRANKILDELKHSHR